jgi:hypothetical protein
MKATLPLCFLPFCSVLLFLISLLEQLVFAFYTSGLTRINFIVLGAKNLYMNASWKYHSFAIQIIICMK